MHDNIIATIIFIIAIAGLIALVVYKLRKDNNNEKVTMKDFLGLYYNNLFNVIQDVVFMLSINIDDFETKEDYERAIISTTIAKLEENCDEFGINSSLFKLVDREVLTNILYDILYTNKIQIFFSTLPEKIVKSKPELYDNEVIEAFENAAPVLNEDTHTEPQEEPEHEEEKVAEQEEAVVDAPCDEKAKEVEQEAELVNEEVVSETDEVLFTEDNNSNVLANESAEEAAPALETAEQLEGMAEMPNADVDSAMHSIRATLITENVDRE